MTDRINHAAEALSALEGAGDGRNFATDAPLVALTHATLALVEQQRIANLIALAALPKIDGFEGEAHDASTEALMGGLLDVEEVAAVPGYGPAGIDLHVFIRPDIAAALGVTHD